jgi:thymidylate synthase
MRILNRTYASADAALGQIAIELGLDGQKVELTNSLNEVVTTTEMLDYQVVFEPNYDNVITLPVRKFPLKGAKAEFLWYMSGNADTDVIAKYLPNWSKFVNFGTLAASNYGYYWHKFTKTDIIDELVRDKHSRRAIIHIYDSNTRPTYKKDTPCTSSIQFFIRKDKSGYDKLSMRVVMRSNDLWYGFCIDQFTFSLYHQLVYNELSLSYPDLLMGEYEHTSNSMHTYDNVVDASKLLQAYKESQSNVLGVHNMAKVELPASVTLSNFWSDRDALCRVFDKDMVKHFYEARAFQLDVK